MNLRFLQKLIILVLIISVFTSGNYVANAEQNNTVIQYVVTKSNNATYSWWDSASMKSYHYSVAINSTVSVSIYNMSDSNTAIDINIGNLTMNNINDSDAESALALGYWQIPYRFGFLANTSWDKLQTDLSDIKDIDAGISSGKGDYLGNNLDIKIVKLKDQYQNTTLIYNAKDGVLLYAYSEVFGFLLELNIFSINQNTTYYHKLFSPFLPVITGVLFTALFIYKKSND